jgi:UDP-2,3-diacylglucosamine pyrophosphatase LpxH
MTNYRQYKFHPECCWSYRPEKVDEYEARLRKGEAPPAITLCDGMLLDGVHRVEAWVRVNGNLGGIPTEELPEGADPGEFVHTQHQGTRALSLKEMSAQVQRRMVSTGKTLGECLKLVNPRWQQFIKNDIGKMAAASAPPRPPKVKAPKIHRQPAVSAVVDTLVRVIIPDSHGEHIDLEARDAFLGDLQALNAHEIVMLGDHLDAGGTMSTHQKSYSAEKTESYMDDCTAANVFLDKIQHAAPSAAIHYLEGNHEQHVERWAAREFESKKDADMILERIGPAAVLNLKRRGIPYYARSTTYMNLSIPGTIKLGECYFVHGVSHSKNADQAHLQRFGANVVFGHVHRVQGMNTRTVESAGHGSWCPGTLAKLQPLYAHTAPTEWSHGYGLQFVARSGAFIHINVPIHKGESLLKLTGLFSRLVG